MKLLFFATFFFLFYHSHAQNTFSLKGTVSDSLGKPVEDGLASLFVQKDSSLVGHALLLNGSFDFEALNANTYFVKISCLGYEDAFQECLISRNQVLRIQLKRNAISLKEIQITGYKQAFSHKNGNIKATVENTVLSTIPDAIEILAKLPTVQVSGDRESVNVIGKGNPLIYLENQRITLNELNALSVNDIKSIEIINNPSSKYDAEGRVVILITRKTNTKEGTRIDINETASLKRYFENRVGVNASVKHQKTEWKGNFRYNHINPYEGLEGVLNSDTYGYQSNYSVTSIGPRTIYLYGIGMYRQLNANDYFSINVNGRFQDEHADINASSYSKQLSTETSTINKNANVNSRPFINANFNYLKKFHSGNSQIFMGGQYAQYNVQLSNSIYSKDATAQLQALEERQQKFKVDVGTARIDYEKTLPNKMKWESGGVWNVSRSSTVFDIHYVPDNTDLYTKYNYDENNQALYSQVSGKYKRMDYTTGLRAENTILQGGYQDSNTLSIDRKFLYLFPKLSASIEIDSNQTISFNYSRTIRRPNYAKANQVSNYITPFLESTNNVNINPSIINEMSVNYQYKTYAIHASVYQILNSISYITEYDALLQKYRMINRNMDRFNGANLSLTIPAAYKSFTSTNEIVATINQVSDSRANASKTIPYYYFYSYNQFKFPRNYTFVVSGWVTTTQYEGIFKTNSKYALDLSISKVFFKRLTCTLNAFDIFRSLNNIESFTFNDIYLSNTYIENVKEFSIALKYSFGRIKDARFKNKEVNENSNRLN
ncbi:MAG: outer membrane beta-barrel family protein [Bacteroidota bacterium]